jgi:hypothetical protein
MKQSLQENSIQVDLLFQIQATGQNLVNSVFMLVYKPINIMVEIFDKVNIKCQSVVYNATPIYLVLFPSSVSDTGVRPAINK